MKIMKDAMKYSKTVREYIIKLESQMNDIKKSYSDSHSSMFSALIRTKIGLQNLKTYINSIDF